MSGKVGAAAPTHAPRARGRWGEGRRTCSAPEGRAAALPFLYDSAMAGYSARDVATMLEIPVAQVRAYAATGVVEPRRGPRGELRFSFQDLVVLRTAKELVAANIPARRVKATLQRLRAQLPNGRPLAEVRIAADGERVVVQDGGMLW